MDQPAHRRQVVRLAREAAEVAVLALVLFLPLHFSIATVRVDGFSMLGTLHDQDYLVATTIDYRLHAPARGDIVVVQGGGPGGQDLIKRVIGLPGERLQIQDGHVLIDGRVLREPYLQPGTSTLPGEWPGPGSAGGLLVPQGQYFVMGDNRGASLDSRSFGPIPRSRIEARAWLRVLPLSAMGTVDGAHPALS